MIRDKVLKSAIFAIINCSEEAKYSTPKNWYEFLKCIFEVHNVPLVILQGLYYLNGM